MQRLGFGRLALLILIGMAIGLTPSRALRAQTEMPREARIQSVLILRMIKFIDWPSKYLQSTGALQLCTWGESSTEAALQSLQGQKVREHEIVVRKLKPPFSTRGCHVVYVSNTVKDLTPGLLYEPGSGAMLTISDMPDFGQRGGIITLIKQSNRIGFDIQLRYAREHGLQIGAPLLELAHMVN